MKLFHSCGDFTRIRGTDMVLHVVKLWPHVVNGDVELWEAATIRLLRYAITDGLISKVDSARQSLSLYLGTLAWRLVERTGKTLVEPLCRLGAEFEAAKLSARQAPPRTEFVGYFRDPQVLRLFRHLHHTIEVEETGFVGARLVPVGSAAEAFSVMPDDQVVLVNAARQNQDALAGLCDCLSERPRQKAAQFILACRVGRGLSHRVTDVAGSRYELPEVYGLLNRLASAGWGLSWRFVENFDRDYILPFEGEMGLAIICGTRGDPEPIDPSFDVYRGPSGTALIPFSAHSIRNYDSGFDWPLPRFSTEDRTDWHAWSAERSWRADQVDWLGLDPSTSADPLVVAHWLAPQSPDGWADMSVRMNSVQASWATQAYSAEGCMLLAALLAFSGDPSCRVVVDRAVGLCRDGAHRLKVVSLFESFLSRAPNPKARDMMAIEIGRLRDISA